MVSAALKSRNVLNPVQEPAPIQKLKAFEVHQEEIDVSIEVKSEDSSWSVDALEASSSSFRYEDNVDCE